MAEETESNELTIQNNRRNLRNLEASAFPSPLDALEEEILEGSYLIFLWPLP